LINTKEDISSEVAKALAVHQAIIRFEEKGVRHIIVAKDYMVGCSIHQIRHKR
jgi:hypothetical protein